MWDLSHTHIYHTINQIGASQLELILWDNVSELIRGYRAGSDTICNNSRKDASHIYIIPQKDQSQLRLFAVVNKTQFNPVNT